MSRKRKTVVWLINDCAGTAHYETLDIKEAMPGASVRRFESVFDTRGEVKGPDVVVIDISAVGSIMGGPHNCYSPICTLHAKFPGSVIVINSAVSSYFAQDVAELVKERCPDAVVRLVDWTKGEPSESFKKILRDLQPAGPT